MDKKNNEYKAAEVDSLMSRINPHFLFNGLNSIASLTNTDGKKAEAMALQLAEFYKYASNRENKIYTTVQEELALLDQYLKDKKMRFGHDRFQSEVDEIPRSLYVSYMLLQPLLENAIKYGYHAATGKTEISLQIKHTGTHLVIKVYDSGRPFDESYSTASASTASTENWKYCTAMIMNCNLSMVLKTCIFTTPPQTVL
ncbi:MAG: histidine kinase [Saprospiraceae bacterium]|nr:histidine kinase [Saprospiraceae bacterium]